VAVETLRQGRSGAQALARLWALDPDDPDPAGPVGNDLVVTCVFGRRDDSPLRFVGVAAPEVPGPEDCAPRPTPRGSPFESINYHAQTDFRPAQGFNAWDRDDVPPGEPRTASWFRFLRPPVRDDGTWEPGTLAVPADVLGPAVHAGIGSSAGFFLVISLQISLQFVADVRTEWLLQHTRAHIADGGYATGTAELWDAERRLVALATQCARLQPLAPRG
jgi:acyl-CoA thioesterase